MATVLIFIATQTGALIFFAGTAVILKNHDERLNKVEERGERTELALVALKTREEIEL